MHNLLSTLKANPSFQELSTSALQPTYAGVPDAHKDDAELAEILDDGYTFDFLGSDISGGVAFFGDKNDIDSVQQKVETYLDSITNYNSQFYIRWDDSNTSQSLILLYDDYIQSANHLVESDVFNTYFGAWTDDYTLPDVLEDTEYCSEWWQVGTDEFDVLNAAHWSKIDAFKSFVGKINPPDDCPHP